MKEGDKRQRRHLTRKDMGQQAGAAHSFPHPTPTPRKELVAEWKRVEESGFGRILCVRPVRAGGEALRHLDTEFRRGASHPGSRGQ